MKLSQVLVTVGTTNFDDLIEKISSNSILKILESKGCTKLIIQHGNGHIKPINQHKTISIESYKYKNCLTEDIRNSSLVISHAGAGTSLEVLEANKLLITVVNEKLMDNHQLELAKRFSDDGYSLYCVPDSLEHTLSSLTDEKIHNLKKYPQSDGKKLGKYLEYVLGFDADR